MKDRLKRVNELIKKELGLILEEDFSVENCLVTVSEAKVSPDLREARIFISTFPYERKDEVLEEIHSHLSKIQEIFGKRIKLKYTPKLGFLFDESFEESAKLDNLFEKIKRDKMDC
jgi:ribosome-binding factor A